MQKLDMSSYGVEELDANEMKDIDGGFIIQSMINTCLAIGVVSVLAPMELFTQFLVVLGDAMCMGTDILA